MTRTRLDAILFDKDGTLFDFTASWAGWTERLVRQMATGQGVPAQTLADALGFDLATGIFERDSGVIAGTVEDCANLLQPHLPDMSRQDLIAYLIATSADAPMVPATPLAPLLDQLRGHGLTLGVATNDSETSARAHLTRAGVLERFTQVLGYDSGFTPKPAPDMLLGFAAFTGINPARVAMVGDSLHDLHAGRAAGMQTIAVLTGAADAATLAPHADAVLPDIGHLPRWLQID